MIEQRYKAAERVAEKKLTEWGIASLPIDPIAIAKEKLGILVTPKPNTANGVSGMLVRHRNTFGILYATHINSEGFQRFSVAHEIGHYVLDGHIDYILPDGDGEHISKAGFVSNDSYELEADSFAAALLMPDPMFSQEIERSGDGLAAVERLAILCRTSLTATAIRYTNKTPTPVAVVMSTLNRVDYCFMSEAFRELEGLTWLRKGSVVPKEVETHQFNRDPANITFSKKTQTKTNLQDWFDGPQRITVTEEVVGLGNYGKTLTIISSDVFADDEDEDEDLEERWAVRFRK